MTLWAVQVSGPSAPTTYYPAGDEAEAAESAARINDWVTGVQDRHPTVGLDVTASVIEWPESPEEHAVALAELRQLENEFEEAE